MVHSDNRRILEEFTVGENLYIGSLLHLMHVITHTHTHTHDSTCTTSLMHVKNSTRCWIPNPGDPCSKPLGGSKVDSAIHTSEVDKMSTRNFWELSGKK